MSIKLIVFDIAGTTVRDNDEVLHCFSAACQKSGIKATNERLNALMGVSKLEVFSLLWREQSGPEVSETEIEQKAQISFSAFREILEDYYRNDEILPTKGALDTFQWARGKGINIALNTGFYKQVTDIILEKLGWLPGQPGSPIDFYITSDQVPAGRPQPYMIRRIMEYFGIADPEQVVKIGDAPVDLMEGRNAGCLFSLGVVNGTQSAETLALMDNDGLLPDTGALPEFLESKGVV